MSESESCNKPALHTTLTKYLTVSLYSILQKWLSLLIAFLVEVNYSYLAIQYIGNTGTQNLLRLVILQNIFVMRSCYCSFKAQLFEVRTKGCSFEKYTTVINHSYRMLTVVL